MAFQQWHKKKVFPKQSLNLKQKMKKKEKTKRDFYSKTLASCWWWWWCYAMVLFHFFSPDSIIFIIVGLSAPETVWSHTLPMSHFLCCCCCCFGFKQKPYFPAKPWKEKKNKKTTWNPPRLFSGICLLVARCIFFGWFCRECQIQFQRKQLN